MMHFAPPFPKIFTFSFFSFLLLFGFLGCRPSTPNKTNVSKSQKNGTLPAQGTIAPLFDYLEKNGELPEFTYQKNEEDDPRKMHLPNKKQMDILIGRLARSYDSTRERILSMKDSVVPYLCVSLLDHYNPWIRRECASLLGEIKSPQSIITLKLGLNDEDTFVQTGCIEALTQFEPKHVQDILYEFFTQKKMSAFTRSTLAISLANMGDTRIVPQLEEGVKKLDKRCQKYQKKSPSRYSKYRYLCWYFHESLRVLNNKRNNFPTLPIRSGKSKHN